MRKSATVLGAAHRRNGTTPESLPAIVAQSVGSPRNDYSGWLGFRFTVGSSNLTVTHLGRWVLSGNTGSHPIEIRDMTGSVVLSDSVATSGEPANDYAYKPISTGTLLAGHTYFILSAETTDLWGNEGDITPSADISIDGSVAGSGAGVIGISNPGNRAFVPPNFKYLKEDTALDPDAEDYFSRIVTAGGTIGVTAANAWDTFVKRAKAKAYWDHIIRINPFLGDNLAAALVPGKKNGGDDTDTNHNFVEGDYSQATGLTGNGSSKYLDTGLQAVTFPIQFLPDNNTHFAIYSRQNGTGTANGHGMQSSNDQFLMYAPYIDGNFYSNQYDSTGGGVVAAITGMQGFLVASRTSASSHKLFKNGVVVGSNTTSGGSVGNTNYTATIFAANINGVPSNFSNQPLGAYSIGIGLSDADVANFNADLEVLMDAVGRGVQ